LTIYRETIYRAGMTTRKLPGGAAFGDDGVQPGRRRKELAWLVMGLVPLSALLAILVLHMMVAASASATGGCGGG
jgi:uncharacterized membrane protein